MSLVVVSAVRFEAEATLELFVRLGIPHEYFSVGIGPLHTARSSVELRERCRGRDVLYLGSCGSFYTFAEPHLVTTQNVYWMPACLRTGIAGFPEHIYPKIVLPPTKLPLPQKDVLTSASVSLTSDFADDVRAKLGSAENLVENMELYACADALRESQSLSIILGVTNEVGPQGRSQWATHFKAVAQMSADYLASRF